MQAKRDWNREVLVDRIIDCFADMGGKPEQLATERQRLLQDDPYLESWQRSISFKPEGFWQRFRRSLKLRFS